MFFNQALKPVRAAGIGAIAVAVAGCSLWPWHHHHASSEPAAEPPVTEAPAVERAAPVPDQTATEAAVAAAPAASAEAAPSEPAAAPPAESVRAAMNPQAPRHYTVKRGDTLWGVASLYLRDPWLWPEIWYVNPQVKNPHLIFPGDVLVLAYGNEGQPQVRLEQPGPVRIAAEAAAARLEPRLRSSALDSAIPTIPYSMIAAFLSRPGLLSSDEVHHAAHVIAFKDRHQTGGLGSEIYAAGLSSAPVGARFAVLHIGDRLRDPENGHVLGYQGIYTGTAVIESPGKAAKALLIDSGRETLRGDCLVAEEGAVPLVFQPHAPSRAVHGHILAVLDNVHMIGQYDIIAINRGKRHGVDVGTVLAIDQVGDVVPDRGPGASADTYARGDLFAHRVHLPQERAGTLLVFKAYDRMSYALVVGATEFITVADIVRSP